MRALEVFAEAIGGCRATVEASASRVIGEVFAMETAIAVAWASKESCLMGKEKEVSAVTEVATGRKVMALGAMVAVESMGKEVSAIVEVAVGCKAMALGVEGKGASTITATTAATAAIASTS